MLYVAMTAAELEYCPELPPHVAWLSCRFSPGSRGLSNLPRSLPGEAMIILSDQNPVSGHDPELVLQQLQQLIERFAPAGILLDFQRPGGEEMVKTLIDALPCPTAVSEAYAGDLECSVFLSPLPLCRSVDLHKWQNRTVWLDVPLCNQTVTVTEKEAIVSGFLPYQPLTEGFFHRRLAVNYKIACRQDCAVFTLSRDLEALRQYDLPQVQHMFCLYREITVGI